MTITSSRFEVLVSIQSQKIKELLLNINTMSGFKFKTLEKHFVYIVNKEILDADRSKFEEVFCDKAYQDIFFDNHEIFPKSSLCVQVTFKPGVTDNTGRSAEDALALLDVECAVASGHLYLFELPEEFIKDENSINTIKQALLVAAKRHISNDLIQNVEVFEVSEGDFQSRYKDSCYPEVQLHNQMKVEEIPLEMSDEQMQKLSEERCLALRVDEVKAIRDHYQTGENTDYRKKIGLPEWPTDVELEVLAQTWSEHCKHKIFQANIDYSEHLESDELKKLGSYQVSSLYKEFVKNTTSRVVEENHYDWLISVFSDNAGIVDYDENLYVCAKVETHNSPSALDPYGGALTGILGVNRDILGCGMGSRPIANTDVFCFAPLDLPEKHPEYTPSNILPPAQILSGVHKGVEDGGNKSGVPTVNGAIYFHHTFAGKPLVFVGTIGVSPKTVEVRKELIDAGRKEVKVDDLIYVVGGEVGADGIHGATFSSLQLDETSPATAVQIGDPITQKRVTDFLVEAQKRGIFSCITDNGAGGISSSIGEMATLTGGAKIDLAKNPVKYPGLRPYEIMISESQERMTLAVPKENQADFDELALRFDVKAVNVGTFTRDNRLQVYFKDELVGDLDLEFLHDGVPKMNLKARFIEGDNWMHEHKSIDSKIAIQKIDETFLDSTFKNILSDLNVASKKQWVSQYDHEVQAATVGKPFIGKDQTSPSDSGVIWLYPHGGERETTIHTGVGLCPHLSMYDTYLMAQTAVDEALRNVVASGADPNKVSLLDNFCWPDPVQSENNPDGDFKLAQLVRACHGLKDACLAYKAPLISGKDSMKNDYKGMSLENESLKVSILPTLLVTAVSKGNINLITDSVFQKEEDEVYLIGSIWGGITASVFDRLYQVNNPKYFKLNYPRLEENYETYQKIYLANQQELLQSCHDVSDGGLITSVFESCFGNELGVKLDLRQVPGMNSKTDLLAFLFNESPGRFIVSVSKDKREMFNAIFKGIPKLKIGDVTNEANINLTRGKVTYFNGNLKTYKEAWLGGSGS